MAQGYSRIEAKNALQRQAIGQILAEPFKHIAMSIPFLWRPSCSLCSCSFYVTA